MFEYAAPIVSVTAHLMGVTAMTFIIDMTTGETLVTDRQCVAPSASGPGPANQQLVDMRLQQLETGNTPDPQARGVQVHPLQDLLRHIDD